MVVILVLVRIGKEKIRYRARTLMAVSTFVGFAYWYTVPPLAMGLRVDSRLATQAVAMFLVMGAFTSFYWNLQWQQLQHKKHLEA
ncbi:hypothetical protein AADX85_15370, partial [Staphylococcus epidermidis]